MIEAQRLVKWFGPTRAVHEVSFSIPKGQVVGFLGPNGAGKTTTIRILTGYLPPTAGAASIAGHDVLTDGFDARKSLGYMPESVPLYPEMRVEELLHFRGRLFGMDRKRRRERIDVVVDRCGLVPVRRRPIGHLSKGNRQRVGLASALLHDPPVLILDEPTAGLDPNQITQVRSLIRELGGEHTVLLSSHILPEVERTADRVLILARGEVVAQGTPEELRGQAAAGSRVVVEARASVSRLKELLSPLQGVESVAGAGGEGGWGRVIITPRGRADPREAVASAMAGAGVTVRELSREAASLEAFFVQITAGDAAASAV